MMRIHYIYRKLAEWRESTLHGIKGATGQNTLPIVLCLFATAMLMSSCSTTSNIPKDEQLYTGIKSIDYNGIKGSKKSEKDSAGIIISIADAARKVNNLLSSKNPGGGEYKNDTLDEKEIRAADKKKRAADAKAWENAKAEVDGVLAYPPNASLFGSSSLRHPLPMGLWFYNGFVNSKTFIGKWIFKNFSQKPKYISMVNPELRARVATNTLHNYGYRYAARCFPFRFDSLR